MNDLIKIVTLICVGLFSSQNAMFPSESTFKSENSIERHFLKSFPLTKLTELLVIKRKCHLTSTYDKDHVIPFEGAIAITVLDEHDSPIAGIGIGKYDTLYEKTYEEEPYKTIGKFKYNTVGSRSYATNGANKGGNIVISQIYFSTSDKNWDVFIYNSTRTDELAVLTSFAKEIDGWLIK